MEHVDNNESKNRILYASIKLFSEKGFDGTRVNEIAEEAKVNKALIYYYFKSKEEILDYLVDSFFESVTSIAMDFVHENIVQMVKDGRLDIKPDRLHFIDSDALELFLKKVDIYYEKIIDYTLEHRQIIRILLLESLKDSKHRSDLFRMLELMNQSEDNPIYKTIWNADRDFNYTELTIMFKFFFSLMPMINFAAYYDDYKKMRSISEQKLQSSFAHSLKAATFSFISGNDILMLRHEN